MSQAVPFLPPPDGLEPLPARAEPEEPRRRLSRARAEVQEAREWREGAAALAAERDGARAPSVPAQFRPAENQVARGSDEESARLMRAARRQPRRTPPPTRINTTPWRWPAETPVVHDAEKNLEK